MNRRYLGLENLESRDLLTTLFVTSDADAGAGTLRDAIDTANSDSSIDRIAFASTVETVELASSVEYTGGQNLAIIGRGANVTTTAATAGTFDLLISSGDANLRIRDIGLSGGSKGFFAPISAEASGTVYFNFVRVSVQDNGLFGIHIDDQTEGSDASLKVFIRNSSVEGNGTGELDFDGVRVDEGGLGGIHAAVFGSTINGNGGDGLELDERGAGGVKMLTRNSSYNDNGFFNEEDLDDGLDIDEADGGSVWFRGVDSTFSNNYDQGLDLDEEQGGNMFLSLLRVQANENLGEGIKADEKFDDDETGSDGNFIAHLRNVEAIGSDSEEGIALSEEGNGSFFANLFNVKANGNDKEGIDLSEEGNGNLRAILIRIDADENNDDGIQIEEAGNGRFAVLASQISANGNSKFGLKVEQEAVALTDLGTLLLLSNDLSGNDDGELDADGVIVF